VFAFIGVENAFSPFRSGVEARVAHSDALRRNGSEEPEWSLRNGGCVAGLPCDDENEGRGKDQEVSVSSRRGRDYTKEDATGYRRGCDWLQKRMRLRVGADP